VGENCQSAVRKETFRWQLVAIRASFGVAGRDQIPTYVFWYTVIMNVPEDIKNQLMEIPFCEGIIFAGSRQNGTPTKESDWDFYVLLEDGAKSFRKTWKYEDTFIETFCNTRESINENELVTNKISNSGIHILATGDIIFDKFGRFAEIQSRAKKLYDDRPPELSGEQKQAMGYTLRMYVDDMKSTEELGQEGYYLQNVVMAYALECFYKLKRKWMVKPRDVEENIKELDSSWGNMYINIFKSPQSEHPNLIVALIEELARINDIPMSGEILQYRKPK
jgi:predicted nucleotidyltransferase